MCNIGLMKNYLKLSNIIIVLLFICWELNAQVALPTFQAFSYAGTGSVLYSFSSHTFTNCGATGKDGPTLSNCTSAYSPSWTDNTSYFNVSNGIQYWTVPDDGTYRILAAGAKGGNANNYNYGTSTPHGSPTSGGYTYENNGATMQGDFTLEKNWVIRILVGQRGLEHNTWGTGTADGFRRGSGGGGGSFVTKSPHTNEASILVIAGGGGGIHWEGNYNYANEGGGRTTTSGGVTNLGYHSQSQYAYAQPRADDGDGGDNGGLFQNNSGGGNSLIDNGSDGGGGFFENGQLGEYNSNSGAGKAYVNGGEGGTSTGSTSGSNSAGHGGFGGGSASGYWSTIALAGAGGGYSGGGGGLYKGYTGSPVGGGGGSKNNGSNQVNTYSNNDNNINSGNGYVIITKQ